MYRLVRTRLRLPSLTSYDPTDSWLSSCLDDDELRTLGVTWPDYARTADELGIDVLRYVYVMPGPARFGGDERLISSLT